MVALLYCVWDETWILIRTLVYPYTSFTIIVDIDLYRVSLNRSLENDTLNPDNEYIFKWKHEKETFENREKSEEKYKR